MYPTVFVGPRDDALHTNQQRLYGHHGHPCHHGHPGHHGVGDHHIHHHPPVAVAGHAHATPMAVASMSPRLVVPGQSRMGLSFCLGMFGVFFFFNGVIMMSVGYSVFYGVGVGGTIFFFMGLAMLVSSLICYRRARLEQQQQQGAVSQQAAGSTTLTYAQPGAQPMGAPPPGDPVAYTPVGGQPMVHPPPPGAAMAYAHAGGQPIAQPQTAGVNLTYGPWQGDTIQPDHPPVHFNAQDPSAAEKAAIPIGEIATAPPPAYEEAVHLMTDSDREKEESRL